MSFSPAGPPMYSPEAAARAILSPRVGRPMGSRLAVRAAQGAYAPLAFSTVNRFCMALLYGRAGRLTAKNGGFRPVPYHADRRPRGGARVGAAEARWPQAAARRARLDFALPCPREHGCPDHPLGARQSAVPLTSALWFKPWRVLRRLLCGGHRHAWTAQRSMSCNCKRDKNISMGHRALRRRKRSISHRRMR